MPQPDDLNELADSVDDLRDDSRWDDVELNEALENERAIRDAFEAVAKTELGVVVLRRIMRLTGFLSPLCLRSATGFDTTGSFYNVARRDVWLELRAYLEPRTLREIENPLGDKLA